jgi:hypothetical protein
MKTTKLWILIFGTAFIVFLFHHALQAQEATAPSTFMDEGESDFEMPKAQVTNTEDAEVKPTTKKKKVGKAKSAAPAREVANDDDDAGATGTKNDAYDKPLVNPSEATQSANTSADANGTAVAAPTEKPVLPKKLPAPKKAKPKVAAEPPVPAAEPGSTGDDAAADGVTPAPGADAMAVSAPVAKKTKARKSASVFTQGFKTTKDGDCAMYESADATSQQILTVKGSKKLWVEQEGEFFKAYHKKGSGYMPAECFED